MLRGRRAWCREAYEESAVQTALRSPIIPTLKSARKTHALWRYPPTPGSTDYSYRFIIFVVTWLLEEECLEEADPCSLASVSGITDPSKYSTVVSCGAEGGDGWP